MSTCLLSNLLLFRVNCLDIPAETKEEVESLCRFNRTDKRCTRTISIPSPSTCRMKLAQVKMLKHSSADEGRKKALSVDFVCERTFSDFPVFSQTPDGDRVDFSIRHVEFCAVSLRCEVYLIM